MSPLTEPTRLTLRKSWQPMDSDAAAYITAVEAADTAAGQSGGLEEKTKIAIDNFVLGCKADGIWSALKASCILSGARTLNGALVPLVGTAPTNFNFVSGDYNRKTGLGDASNTTKYLDTNRALNADPLNSFHMAIRVSSGTVVMGNPTGLGDSMIRGDNAVRARSSLSVATATPSAPYFTGVNRADSATFAARAQSINFTFTRTSTNADTGNCAVYLHNNVYSSGRLAFYSIGESLNLALLDARVTDLINAFGAAIP